MPTFAEVLASGYPADSDRLILGAALEGGTVHREPKVAVPLAMVNRHGLIAGATGTGKTKTLQLMAEQLSAAGVPVFAADVKGDLSGVAAVGVPNDKVEGRARDIGYTWEPRAMPAEFVSLTGKLGVQLRATVSSFGPLLLAKVLSLNETQAGVLAMVFRYADEKGLPLLDFEDLDLRGRPIAIEFWARLRDEVKYDAVDDLIAAIADDVAATRVIVPDPERS